MIEVSDVEIVEALDQIIVIYHERGNWVVTIKGTMITERDPLLKEACAKARKSLLDMVHGKDL